MPNVLYGMLTDPNSTRKELYYQIKKSFTSIFPDLAFDISTNENIPFIEVKHQISDFQVNMNE